MLGLTDGTDMPVATTFGIAFPEIESATDGCFPGECDAWWADSVDVRIEMSGT
jgi:hypothetical protein